MSAFPDVAKGETILEVKDLVKHFPVTEGILIQSEIGRVKAVDGVSFKIAKGETLGLVGESGCGKTTTGRCILQLERPTSGEVVFKGSNLERMSDQELNRAREQIQVIFQDPYSSLNPRMKVGDILGEPMRGPRLVSRCATNAARHGCRSFCRCVGLNPRFADRYPHEMSGGQRQRVGIARALSLNPDFIICDEAVSALWTCPFKHRSSICSRICARSSALTYLFIAHDLSVVHHLCNRVAVMYLGKVAELAESDELFDNPDASVYPAPCCPQCPFLTRLSKWPIAAHQTAAKARCRAP